MKEYKTFYAFDAVDLEQKLNSLARDGWTLRDTAMRELIAKPAMLIVIMERERPDGRNLQEPA